MNKYKFIGSVILLFIIGFTFMNYGYINNHPTINKLIIKEFIKINYGGLMSDFENYRFELYKPKLKGSFISKSGLFNPSNSGVGFFGDRSVMGLNSTYTEEVGKFTPQKWIEDGGFAADVPEVPASLRHFYDPTRGKTERYLSDKVNSKVMRFAQSFLPNPKTNGVDWALGTGGNYGVLEHIYTWEHGKKYVKGALEESNLEKRNNYMAKAWRSLGETLHMIADNGCPVHVRNDGHPPIPIPIFSYFGNPDPYEELMEIKDISKYDLGSIPIKLQDNLREAKTVKDIAHKLAVFTNENIFSNETISGIDWKGNKIKPITNPKYIHKSPKISSHNYKKNYYRKKVGGKEVLLCTDTWFFKKYPVYKTFPYINEECVESQAKVLVPAIKEAGVNTMKLFIPKLKIFITKIDENGYIAGVIKHETDEEYKKEIRYNGLVRILNDRRSEISKLNAIGGQFSGKINIDENINVVAQINFGGISVHSKPFKTKAKKEIKEQYKVDLAIIEIWFEAEVEEIDDEDTEIVKNNEYIAIRVPFKPTIVKSNKINSNSTENDDEYGNIQRTISLKFNDNGKYRSMNGFSFKRSIKGGSEGEDSFISAEGHDIPFKVENYSNSGHSYLSYSYKGDISKYLTKINFTASGNNYDNTKWSKRLKNYKSPGEIKIRLHFVDQIHDYKSIE